MSEAPGPAGSVGALGEDGLIAMLLARFRGSAPGPAGGASAPAGPLGGVMPVGPGDDAAVLAVGTERIVLSTDTLVEGRDFRTGTSSGRDVGVKAAAQSFADVAAMGARPVALVVSLAAPAGTPVGWVDGLADGLAAECGRAGAVMAGGDVSEATEIVVTGTAIGSLDGGAAVLRSGARAGDVVALAGSTGPAAAGLALLESGRLGGFESLLAAQRRPAPPYRCGPAAATAHATAMIDTSDGLVRDALRVASASGVVIDLELAALAPSEELLAAARELSADPADWLLGGGEDHALLACFGPGTVLPEGFRRIGTVRAGAAAVLVDGQPWAGSAGWRHYRG